jgi:hypothetical protein
MLPNLKAGRGWGLPAFGGCARVPLLPARALAHRWGNLAARRMAGAKRALHGEGGTSWNMVWHNYTPWQPWRTLARPVLYLTTIATSGLALAAWLDRETPPAISPGFYWQMLEATRAIPIRTRRAVSGIADKILLEWEVASNATRVFCWIAAAHAVVYLAWLAPTRLGTLHPSRDFLGYASACICAPFFSKSVVASIDQRCQQECHGALFTYVFVLCDSECVCVCVVCVRGSADEFVCVSGWMAG